MVIFLPMKNSVKNRRIVILAVNPPGIKKFIKVLSLKSKLKKILNILSKRIFPPHYHALC
jgi:hypothetical protein